MIAWLKLKTHFKDPYLDDFSPNDIVRLLIINEVEKCLKLRPGKLFKVKNIIDYRKEFSLIENKILIQ